MSTSSLRESKIARHGLNLKKSSQLLLNDLFKNQEVALNGIPVTISGPEFLDPHKAIAILSAVIQNLLHRIAISLDRLHFDELVFIGFHYREPAGE